VLEELGVLNQLRPMAGTINSLSITGYGATATAHVTAAASGLGVRRELLDTALLSEARASGVDVQLGVTAVGLVPDAVLAGCFRASQRTKESSAPM